MAERYASRGRTMARSNTKQAWLPRDCEILDNPVGTACGFVVRHPASHGQSRLFFTPGVPFEFKQMVREQIMPRLKALAGEETDTELRRFYTFGVSESALSDMLDAAPWPAGIELGYRSSTLAELKLIGHGASTADMDAAEARLLAAIAPWLVGVATRRLPARSWPCWGAVAAPARREEPGRPADHVSRAPGPDRRLQPHPERRSDSTGGARRPLSLTIGRAGPDGVPLLLCADGQLHGQTLRVSHPDPASGRRISPSPPSTCCAATCWGCRCSPITSP
jgi:molybdopterin-biosynthesis enzyme MoeA-like protein